MSARSLTPPATPSVVVARACAMRRSLTESEETLWRAIRGRRLGGVQFRRQVPVGRFVVDFLAPKERLVVEVDGGYHSRRKRADARRDEKLRRWGYRVLRLEAERVIRELPVALERIRAALAAAANTAP